MKNKENLREKQVNLRLTQAAYLRMVLRGAWLREDGRKSE